MSNVFLKIFEDAKCNSTFLRCNSNIIKKHLHLFKSVSSNKEKFFLLEQLWKTELNIDLVPSGNWTQLNFRSDKDKTMFLLKWQR